MPLAPAAIKGKWRGRAPRRTGHNLLLRLAARKQDTLRFLHDPTVPFTNNQAERDGRMMKLRQKISGGFRSPQGAMDFALIRSFFSTAKKQGWNIIDALTRDPSNLSLRLSDPSRQAGQLQFFTRQTVCWRLLPLTERRGVAGAVTHLPHPGHWPARRLVHGTLVEVTQIVVHEGREPKAIVDLFDSNGLAGEDLAEVDFLAIEADAAAGGDGDRLVVERIVKRGQAGIGTRRRRVELGRAMHGERLVRPLLVVQRGLLTPTEPSFGNCCTRGIHGMVFGSAFTQLSRSRAASRGTAAAAAGWTMASRVASPLAVCGSMTPLRMRFSPWSAPAPLQRPLPPRKKPTSGAIKCAKHSSAISKHRVMQPIAPSGNTTPPTLPTGWWPAN